MIETVRSLRICPHAGGPPSTPYPAMGRCPMLSKISQVPRGPSGKQKVRQALRLLLSRCFVEPVSLMETNSGPHLLFPSSGRRSGVSISYAAGQAWIAIAAETPVGVDAVCFADIPPFEAREALASLYLDAPAQARLHRKRWQTRVFAEEWSSHEARCKLGKIPLSEGRVPPSALLFEAREPGIIIRVAIPDLS